MGEEDARTWPTPLPALEAEEPGGGHFVRDHLGAPTADARAETVSVGGAVEEPFEVGLDELRARPAREEVVVLECAGHRRDEYQPAPEGVQWGVGAVGEATWRGAALHELIAQARPANGACEVVLHGADGYARSLPLDKALEPGALVAYEMDGRPLPDVHGAPLRVVVPGWYATDGVKWLTAIELVTEPFGGPFQMDEYRWIEPGEEGIGDRLYGMPVSSLVTTPDGSESLEPGPAAVRGVAWSDGTAIERVEVRIDEGEWRQAELTPPPGRFALTRWHTTWQVRPGWHTIESRATDGRGRTQPLHPQPNQGGYANNAVHRVALEVEGGG